LCPEALDPHNPTGKGSDATACPMALYPTSLLGRALMPTHIMWFLMGR
jgi:hypothetical protein